MESGTACHESLRAKFLVFVDGDDSVSKCYGLLEQTPQHRKLRMLPKSLSYIRVRDILMKYIPSVRSVEKRPHASQSWLLGFRV